MEKLTIKNTIPVQNCFEGIGATYHGYAGMPDCRNRDYDEEFCKLEAKRATDIKLKIARTFYKWYAYDKNTGEWDWNNKPELNAFYRWLERMKEGNVDVMLSAGWWLPSDLTIGTFHGRSPFYVEGDWPQTVKNYAKWVSEEVHQLVEVRGFTNVKYLVLFTEPNNAKIHPEIPERHPFDLWKDCVLAVDKQLKEDGRRHLVKLMGPNTASLENFHSDLLDWFVENAFDTVDVVSGHSYQQTKRIDSKCVKTGFTAANFDRAGARISQTADLKGGKEYTVTVDVMGSMPDGSPLNVNDGRYHQFGAFEYEGRNNIWSKNHPSVCYPVAENSVKNIYSSDISTQYTKISTTFKVEKDCKANIGFFYDFTADVNFSLDSISLTEKGSSENLLTNGNFENLYTDWYALYAGGVPYYYLQWKDSADKCRKAAGTKEFCYDEYNSVFERDYSRTEHGMEICSATVAFMNAGLESCLLWTLFDHIWPNSDCNSIEFFDGDHRCGTAPVLNRSLVPYRSYYAFSLLTRFVDKKSKIYEGFSNTVSPICGTMAENTKGEITVIAINGGETAVDFKFDFEKSLGKNLNRHLFDPNTLIPDEKAEIIKADKEIFVGDALSDTLPPFSVAVYTNIKL